MFKFLPPKRPHMELGQLLRIAHENKVNVENEVCIIGIRGFYGSNAIGKFDDAIFVVAPHGCKAFNANTDPGALRKGIASLVTGTWLYEIGVHGLSKPKILQYKALTQAEPVVVQRYQGPLDKGRFGINIHKSTWIGVSSEGCQTIYRGQWDEFINFVETSMKRYNQKTVKYILKEMRDDVD